MGLLPAPHPGGVLGVAEVVAVLRLTQPAALAGRLACEPTLGLAAVLLPAAVADIGSENLPAGHTPALVLVRHALPPGAHFAKQAQPDRRRPRRPAAGPKTGENKTLEISSSEENGREENLDVQTGRITRKLTRRSHPASLSREVPDGPTTLKQRESCKRDAEAEVAGPKTRRRTRT